MLETDNVSCLTHSEYSGHRPVAFRFPEVTDLNFHRFVLISRSAVIGSFVDPPFDFCSRLSAE